MDKTQNNRAWLLVLPVFVLVAFSAIIPLMTVVNYAFQDIFGPQDRVWVGVDWFREVLERRRRCAGPLDRQLVFSLAVLLIEIPLGIALALAMPARGVARLGDAGADGPAAADPLERRRHDLADLRPRRHRPRRLGRSTGLGLDYNYTHDSTDAWLTILVMDVWHWTPLVALLCYAGLRAIPGAYYQAAAIDGASRWAVFRFIELPRMRGVLLIAVLLRFMDSFMIYTEPFVVTGGGPGNATTFLSIHLAKIAVGQFDLGPGGRVLARLLPHHPDAELRLLQRHDPRRHRGPRMTRRIGLTFWFVFLLVPIYWLFNMSFKTNEEILSGLTLIPTAPDARELRPHLHRSRLVLGLPQLLDLRRHQRRAQPRRRAARGL